MSQPTQLWSKKKETKNRNTKSNNDYPKDFWVKLMCESARRKSAESNVVPAWNPVQVDH